MSIKLGSADISTIKLGSTDINKIYLGSTEIYSTSSLWTPAEISTALWLDADDANTITLNGSTVSQWDDKSTNDRHATQGSATLQPTYSATGLNSKPTIQFDGIDDILLANSVGVAIGSNNFTILAVCRFPSQAGHMISMRESTGLVTRGYIARSTTDTFNTAWGDPSVSPADFTLTDETNHIIGAYRTGTAINNLANGVIGTGATVNFKSAFGTFALGAFGAGTTAWSNVWFSEIIVVTGTMTTDDRQKIEGYLAWKWGLEANLPVGHPYELSAPTV